MEIEKILKAWGNYVIRDVKKFQEETGFSIAKAADWADKVHLPKLKPKNIQEFKQLQNRVSRKPTYKNLE